MVSIQTLKLLDALLAGSSGSQTEQLLALYKEAFRGTESFKNLADLLEGCEFYGTVGRELRTKGEDVVKAGFTNAGSFGDSITVMDYVIDKVRKELETATEYVRSANVSGASLSVLDKRLAESATKFYDKLFNYVCYMYATLYGEGILRNMKIGTGLRSVDLIRSVNDELCTLIADARKQEKPQAWRILRCNFVGANLVRYGGFVLEYGGITPEYLQNQCDQLSPFLFRDPNHSNVLCCGIGHLTSLEPQDGARIYGAQVTGAPAMNCLDNYNIDYASLDIRRVISTIAGNGVCVMDPKDMVELLNRYFMIKTANENQQRGCIYCGRNGCRHFAIPTNF